MTNQPHEDASRSESVQALESRIKSNQIPEPTPSRAEVEMNDASAALCYANFCRVTGTPEELILDFGLNTQPFGATKVDIKQRLILNFFTAKRLFQALGMSIQRHEAAFGLLETDVQKRVSPALRRAASGE